MSEVTRVVETYIAAQVAWRRGRVAAVMIADQRVPRWIGVNHWAKLVNYVLQSLLAAGTLCLVSVPWSGHKVCLNLLISYSRRFVCSERHFCMLPFICRLTQ